MTATDFAYTVMSYLFAAAGIFICCVLGLTTIPLGLGYAAMVPESPYLAALLLTAGCVALSFVPDAFRCRRKTTA
ncbi:MAG: hypothetical protein H7Y60_12330 [Rhodospirillaceae bacterium]|nr:hypothetical protein [Rhodospirillales bacterium]